MSYQAPYTSSPYRDPNWQRREDENHLNLLAIFHYVLGGLTMLGGIVFLIWVVFGGLIAAAGAGASRTSGDAAGAQIAGGLFVFFGLLGVTVCFVAGGLKVWAGRCLQAKHGYTFATVMACLECLHMPLGTALGIFTLVVLSRPSVRAMFAGEAPLPAGDPVYAAPPEGGDWYRRGN